MTDKTSTTGLVESISQTGGNFTYTYDDNGNIVSVVQDGVTTSYTYDALGQLIRVVDGQEGATWEYTYDQGGNILTKKKYVNGIETESMDFEYTNENWRDQLTKVNDKTITYDKIGNPLNDGTWTYTWQNGRQLQKMQKSGETVEFVYNENGLRVQKTATTTGVTQYTLRGNIIHHMSSGSNELHFFYDAKNKPAIVVYNGAPFSYAKNIQGDIVAILDSNKNVVVSYVYDAWGRPISCSGTMANTLGKINPFRYRSYVYDEETGLYYLRTRYYDPLRCRFIIPDSNVSGSAHCTLSHNSYCYCCSNPVKNIDPNGEFLNCILGGVIGGLVGGIVSGVDALIEGKTVEEALDSAVSGAISGAVSGAVAGLCADVAIATGGVGGIALAAAGGAYLIAMKLRAGRKYKNDLSDIVGILAEHEQARKPICYEMIDAAVKNLYGGWDPFSADSVSFIRSILDLHDYSTIYAQIRESEVQAKELLLDFQKAYPGVAQADNVDSIIESRTAQQKKTSVLAQLQEMKKAPAVTSRPKEKGGNAR